MKLRATALANLCERSAGTVFQLPSPDAIYSQDKEKVKELGYQPMLFVFAHGPRAAEARTKVRDRREGGD